MAAPAVYAAGLIEFPPRPGTLTLVPVLALAEQAGLTTYMGFDTAEREVVAKVSAHYAGKGASAKKFQCMDVMMAGRGFKDLPDVDSLAAIAHKVLHHPLLEKEYLAA
jgi:hypothetical protein